jgi:DNA-binding transcriptional ArsR family regulator
MNLTTNQQNVSDAVQVFSALGSEKRLQIVQVLGKKEMTVTDISTAVSCRLSSVSQNLLVLKNSGIVSARRDGHEVYYKIALPCVHTFLGCLLKKECSE